jgi:hypothetical protein
MVWFCHVTMLVALAILIVQIPYVYLTMAAPSNTVFVAYPDTFTIPYATGNNTLNPYAYSSYSVTPFYNESRDTSVRSLNLCNDSSPWPCQSIPLTPLLLQYTLPSTIPAYYNTLASPSIVSSLLCTDTLLNVTLQVSSNVPLYVCMNTYTGTVMYNPRNISTAFPLTVDPSAYSDPTSISLATNPSCYTFLQTTPILLFYAGQTSEVNLTNKNLGTTSLMGSLFAGAAMLALALLALHIALPRYVFAFHGSCSLRLAAGSVMAQAVCTRQ